MNTSPPPVTRPKGRFFITMVATATGLLAGTGCTQTNHHVVASTGTVIGVELGQSAANQSPEAKLGYNRAEVAIVPSNRSSTDATTPESGADQTAEVMMELRYAGIFSTGDNSGIYQRLAVGKEAVKQPGAAFMFARPVNGELSAETAQVVASVVAGESVASSPAAAEAVLAIRNYIKDQEAKDPIAKKIASDMDALGALVPNLDFPVYSRFDEQGNLNSAGVLFGKHSNAALDATGFARVNEYAANLRASIAVLEAVKAAPATFKDNATKAALTDDVLVEIGGQLVEQKTMLAKLERMLGAEPAMKRALDYFNQAMGRTS